MTFGKFLPGFKQRLLLATLCIVPAVAMATTPFSPYVDFTLDVHWSTEHNTDGELEPIDLLSLSAQSGVKNYHVAFIINDLIAPSACNPLWGGYYHSSSSNEDQWGKYQLADLQKAGIPYTIAFGGAVGTDISKVCTNQDLIAKYEDIISSYRPAGIDFDVENSEVNLDNMMAALVKIQAEYPSVALSFTLPVMPTGLNTGDGSAHDFSGTTVLTKATAQGLRYTVNLMAMDYNLTGDMGAFATQAASSVHDFLATLYPDKTSVELWAMISLTPMIGRNDNGSPFELKDATTVQSFAEQNHLAWLSMWSFNRDHSSDAEHRDGNHDSADWDGTVYQSGDYVFSHIFQGAKTITA